MRGVSGPLEVDDLTLVDAMDADQRVSHAHIVIPEEGVSTASGE
jgi:hypothetical protein